MADPLSVSSGLLAIVTATVQSGKVLYDLIQSFRNHQAVVLQFKNELKGLNTVLLSLEDHVRTDETAFLPLKAPLFQCCQTCTEFQTLIAKHSQRSSVSRTSIRDWAGLRYMQGNITELTNMLAGYKSTINIALADANLRSSKVTLQVLNEYKDMIDDTKHDLENHLRDINSKLQSLASRDRELSNVVTTELERVENEKDSVERGLEICSQFLAQMNAMRFQTLPAQSTSEGTAGTISPHDLTLADTITLTALKACSAKLSETMAQLRTHKETAEERLQADITEPSQDLEPNSELSIQRMQAEVESTNQRLEFCERASAWASSGRVHVVEDITVGDNSQQVCISTLGDLFKIKGANAGDGSIQFIGSTSETALLEIMRAASKRQQKHVQDDKVATEEEFCTSGGGGSSAI